MVSDLGHIRFENDENRPGDRMTDKDQTKPAKKMSKLQIMAICEDCHIRKECNTIAKFCAAMIHLLTQEETG